MIRPGPRERPIPCWAGRWPSTTWCATRHRHAVGLRRRLSGRRARHRRPVATAAGRATRGLGTAGKRLRTTARLGRSLFVAGGIGQTPFLALGRSWLQKAGARALRSMTLLYGVRTAALLAGVDDFRRAGIDVELATDDGTAGHHGFVTELLARRLASGERPAKVVGCGPPAMLAALAKLVANLSHPLRRLSRKPHGVRLRCMLQLRRPDPPGRRLDRPPTGLRRGTGRAGRSRRLGGDGPLNLGTLAGDRCRAHVCRPIVTVAARA